MNKLLASLGLCLVASMTLVATIAGPVSAGRPDKISVCHVDVDAGTVTKLSVGASAASAHVGHGDVLGSDEPCPPVAAPTAESVCGSVGGVFSRPDDGVVIWTCADVDTDVEGAAGSLGQQCADDGGLAGLTGTAEGTLALTCAELLPVDAAGSLCVSLGGVFSRPDDGVVTWTCAAVDTDVEGAAGSLGQQCADDGGLAGLTGTAEGTFSLSCSVIDLQG